MSVETILPISITVFALLFTVWSARELRRERLGRIEVESYLRGEIRERDDRITEILESQRRGVESALRFVNAESKRMTAAPMPDLRVRRMAKQEQNGEASGILPDE